MSKYNPLPGMALCLVGFLCFSLHDTIGKYLAERGHNPVFLTFCLTNFMLVTLVLAAPALGGWRNTLRTKEKKLHIFRAVTILPAIPINVYAFTQMPLSTVYAILMCTPMLTTLLARFVLGEKHPRKVYALIACGFVGVAISLHPGVVEMSWAVAGCIFTAGLGAVRAITLRKAGADETPLALLLFPSLAMNIAYLIPALKVAAPLSAAHTGLLFVEGFLFTAGFIGTTMGYRKAPAAYAAMTHYSQIIWGILFGWLVFNNQPDALTLLGSAIILGSGLALVWFARPKRPVNTLDIEID